MFRPLMESLMQQKRSLSATDIEICWDSTPHTSGAKRNQLMAKSIGEFVAFVDDDDVVNRDYVRLLREACKTLPECVTFPFVRLTESEMTICRQVTTSTETVILDGVMHIPASPLCAWRRDVASRVSYDPRLGYADDCLWSRPLLADRPYVANNVDEALYCYRVNRETTANSTLTKRLECYEIVGMGIECFRQGGELLIAWDNLGVTQYQKHVKCRNRRNETVTIARDESEMYYLWRAC